VSSIVDYTSPVPKDNDIELFYRISVFHADVDGHIEYRADGVYYNLHMKNGCLRAGRSISARYVIWVSTGNRRNEDFYLTTIDEQSMYWYHEGEISFSGDCTWINPYTQSPSHQVIFDNGQTLLSITKDNIE
jgi:hypothetical protein